MAKTDTEIKFSIEHAIKAFSSGNLTENTLNLFQVLGYNTDRQQPLPDKTFACFKEYYIDTDSRFNEEKALAKEWQQIDLLFQLTKEEVTGQNSLFDTAQVDRTIMEAYLFFCIELNEREYTRTALSEITREINKVFKMPVMVLFKLGETLSLAVINRRLHKKDAEKDVLEKVTLIKDINIPKPHRAHIEILFDLTIEKLQRVHKFTNFVELHEAWKKTLDTKELNKRFYKELSNWYFWAIKEVYFPGAPFQATLGANAATDPQVREHNAKNLIRLLTRLLFVWFVKEKNLVPDQLFDERFIKESLLTGFDPAKTSTFDDHAKASRYYRAVLQNLFFASLNQIVGKREFRKQGQHMNVTNLMRYESYFKDPQAFVALIDNVVPFMNGGLFECLDKPDPQKKGKQGGDVIIYEDGFSDRADNTLCVPDYIFFSNSEHADLSSELDDKKQCNVTVRGLINILNDYKFTVTENTPIEEDIALDPELLGRVFENLLASYNPETKTTARKQTGSFYTPREIVDYMVDESLKAYLKQKLVAVSGMKAEDADVGLNILFSYTEKEHAFNNDEKHVLIEAIDACKVLDPACGSGAFPMGILHKLVLILHKLDPDNVLWREQQRQNAIKETENAFRIGNQEERDNRLKDISDVFENNASDYGRKLYLIENCIYGVDIQAIATQISKLRFFISLIVEQQSNKDKAHNYGVLPLPNLETKFVAANTLLAIEKPKQGDFTGGLFDDSKIESLENELKSVRHRLFSAKTPLTKRKLREEDKRLREQIGASLAINGWGNDTANKLAAWDPYDHNATSLFFDMEWMFGITDGFNIVIGNPPYLKERDNKHLFDLITSTTWGKLYHEGKMDYWFFFLHRALELGGNHGIISLITSRYWLKSTGSKKLIKHIREKAALYHVVDIGKLPVFEIVAGHHMLHFYCIGAPQSSCRVKTLEESLENLTVIHSQHVQITTQSEGELFSDRGEIHLYPSHLVLPNTLTIGDRYEVSQGVVQNPDRVSTLMEKRYGLKRGAGVFVLEPSEFEALRFNELELTFIRPFYDESAVNRFYLKRTLSKQILYLTKKNCMNLSGLPNIEKHLKTYRQIMDGRRETVNGLITWFQLHWPRDPRYFESSKVVLPSMFRIPNAAFIPEPAYFGMGSNVIIGSDKRYTLKLLCGILNSNLGLWWFTTNGKQRGIGIDVGVDRLRQFPLPLYSDKFNEIEVLTEVVITKLFNCPTSNTRSLEQEINNIVYQLYKLTPEEIAIIEK